MSKTENKHKSGRRYTFILSVVSIFIILGAVVYSVAGQISSQMSQSAIDNLSESLGLLRGTMQAILQKEAEFQKLISQELALMENPENLILSYNSNKTMIRISLVPSGQAMGISNNGEDFSAESLDFSAGMEVDGLPLSGSYLNEMGTWAYTLSCPVVKDGTETATQIGRASCRERV